MGIIVITLLTIVLIYNDLPAFALSRLVSARKVQLLSGSELLFNDGRAAYWQKRYRDAIRMLRPAAQLRPERAMTWYYLGLSWAALGNFAEADRAYQEVLRLDPEGNLTRSGPGHLSPGLSRRSP